MKVRVLQSHVSHGVQRNSQHCMIADAIKAACPQAQHVLVDLQSIRFSDPVKRIRYTYLTPAVAQQRLLRFDQGKRVQPFEIKLESPIRKRPMCSKSGSMRNGKNKLTPAQHKFKYAYLIANRARANQKEREFGIRKFTEA